MYTNSNSTKGTHNYICFDSPHTIDLTIWETPLKLLAKARDELERAIASALLNHHTPPTRALGMAIKAISTAEKISLLTVLAERDFFEFPQTAARYARVIKQVARSCEAADIVIARFTLGPSRVNPDEITAAAALLEESIVQLSQAD